MITKIVSVPLTQFVWPITVEFINKPLKTAIQKRFTRAQKSVGFCVLNVDLVGFDKETQTVQLRVVCELDKETKLDPLSPELEPQPQHTTVQVSKRARRGQVVLNYKNLKSKAQEN